MGLLVVEDAPRLGTWVPRMTRSACCALITLSCESVIPRRPEIVLPSSDFQERNADALWHVCTLNRRNLRVGSRSRNQSRPADAPPSSDTLLLVRGAVSVEVELLLKHLQCFARRDGFAGDWRVTLRRGEGMDVTGIPGVPLGIVAPSHSAG
jgi:hypothetical protein